MQKREYILIGFPGVHHSLKCEKILKNEGLSPRFYPLPPEITADCNFGLELKPEEFEISLQLMEERDIERGDIFHIKENGGEKIIDKIEEEDRRL